MEVLLVVEKSHWSPFVNLRRQHPLPQRIPLSRHRCPPGHEFWEASGMALRARGNLVMFQSEKEKKKQLSKEDKKALQEEKLKQEEKYMWAIVDGVKEKVGEVTVLYWQVGEVVKMMESELGSGWILYKLCKVTVTDNNFVQDDGEALSDPKKVQFCGTDA